MWVGAVSPPAGYLRALVVAYQSMFDSVPFLLTDVVHVFAVDLLGTYFSVFPLCVGNVYTCNFVMTFTL